MFLMVGVVVPNVAPATGQEKNQKLNVLNPCVSIDCSQAQDKLNYEMKNSLIPMISFRYIDNMGRCQATASVSGQKCFRETVNGKKFCKQHTKLQKKSPNPKDKVDAMVTKFVTQHIVQSEFVTFGNVINLSKANFWELVNKNRHTFKHYYLGDMDAEQEDSNDEFKMMMKQLFFEPSPAVHHFFGDRYMDQEEEGVGLIFNDFTNILVADNILTFIKEK